MGLFRTKLSCCALVVALSACTTVPASNDRLPVGEKYGDRTLSPFYTWAEELPKAPGTLLRSEAMPVQPEFTAASLMQRILYTSTDIRWNSGMVPVSGTLYLPRGTPPAGGWPIVAWAHGTVGVADVCAPSWALHRPRDATYLNRWLEQGIAVVATDYQGLGGPGPHPYLIWQAEGRSVLDSVRAARAAYPGQIANQVIITGQSQGSGSSIGASRLVPVYAPELNLRATIATGVLSSFPEGPYKLERSVSGSGAPSRFNVLRLIGGNLRDDATAPESLLTEQGRHLLQKARETCVDELRAHEQKNGLDMASVFNVEPASLDAVLRPVTDMTLVKMPAPVFLGTGLADRTVPPRRQFGAASALCAAGGQLVWKTYAGITHNGIVNVAFDDEMLFVRRLFAGQGIESNCAVIAEPGLPGVVTAGVRFND